MFGYSLALLFGRLFGLPLFVMGILFLKHYRAKDEPKVALRKAFRHPLVWFFLVLAWVAFALEIVYVSHQPPAGP